MLCLPGPTMMALLPHGSVGWPCSSFLPRPWGSPRLGSCARSSARQVSSFEIQVEATMSLRPTWKLTKFAACVLQRGSQTSPCCIRAHRHQSFDFEILLSLLLPSPPPFLRACGRLATLMLSELTLRSFLHWLGE